MLPPSPFLKECSLYFHPWQKRIQLQTRESTSDAGIFTRVGIAERHPKIAQTRHRRGWEWRTCEQLRSRLAVYPNVLALSATPNSLDTHNLLTFLFRVSGRCGHGSPCEQLCYELHDGMYECDCRDGYILHKNGYSCAGECESIWSLSRFAIRIYGGRRERRCLIEFRARSANFLTRHPHRSRNAEITIL